MCFRGRGRDGTFGARRPRASLSRAGPLQRRCPRIDEPTTSTRFRLPHRARRSCGKSRVTARAVRFGAGVGGVGAGCGGGARGRGCAVVRDGNGSLGRQGARRKWRGGCGASGVVGCSYLRCGFGADVGNCMGPTRGEGRCQKGVGDRASRPYDHTRAIAATMNAASGAANNGGVQRRRARDATCLARRC